MLYDAAVSFLCTDALLWLPWLLWVPEFPYCGDTGCIANLDSEPVEDLAQVLLLLFSVEQLHLFVEAPRLEQLFQLPFVDRELQPPLHILGLTFVPAQTRALAPIILMFLVAASNSFWTSGFCVFVSFMVHKDISLYLNFFFSSFSCYAVVGAKCKVTHCLD